VVAGITPFSIPTEALYSRRSGGIPFPKLYGTKLRKGIPPLRPIPETLPLPTTPPAEDLPASKDASVGMEKEFRMQNFL
jgi:hypothetical protein